MVADWNNCLMPRDTDRRLLGLWGLELSVEQRRRGSDRMRIALLPKYIYCADTRDLSKVRDGFLCSEKEFVHPVHIADNKMA